MQKEIKGAFLLNKYSKFNISRPMNLQFNKKNNHHTQLLQKNSTNYIIKIILTGKEVRIPYFLYIN